MHTSNYDNLNPNNSHQAEMMEDNVEIYPPVPSWHIFLYFFEIVYFKLKITVLNKHPLKIFSKTIFIILKTSFFQNNFYIFQNNNVYLKELILFQCL